ncbi:MAG: choice-of-anchor L domain-containing protein [Prevotellaceae bacterium]|jgi:gliding motility-associated-like protein|nr:choice-of-anchor L domain-containing protein [Prevotellaceae bacterium]
MKQFFVTLLIIITFLQIQIADAQSIRRDSLLKKRQEALQGKMQLHTVIKSDPVEGSIEIDRNPEYANLSPQQLLEQIFVKSGSCVLIENVQYKGAGWTGTQWDMLEVKTMAYFNKASSNFPLKEGILLSTANTATLEGPNDSKWGAVIQDPPPFIGDDDLSSLLTDDKETVYDVVVLEFDFVPIYDVIEFRYVFASEEYPNFVNDTYNDVFGFFINEVGNSIKENIARLPTTNTLTDVVSINNVNNGQKWNNDDDSPGINPSNPEYFIPNINNALTTEFNGYTVALTAKCEVVPCKKYHLKFAICNVGDKGWPSGIFMETNSFNVGAKLEHYGNNVKDYDEIFEGCETNTLKLLHTGNMDNPIDVEISYTGTAVNGVDYLTDEGEALPTYVTIPAGVEYIDIVYGAVDDGKDNTDKYFDINIACPCDDMGSYTKRIKIYDHAKLTSVKSNCSSITAQATGGSGAYEFTIDSGKTWQESGEFLNLPEAEYTLWMRDVGSCFESQKQIVKVGQKDVSAGENQTQCDNATFVMSATEPLSGEKGQWTLISPTPGVVISEPTVYNTMVTVPVDEIVILQWSIIDGECVSSAEVVLVNLAGIEFSLKRIGHECSEVYDVELVSVSGGNGNYQYSMDNGATWQTSPIFKDVSLGTYTVMVKDNGLCESSMELNLTGGFNIKVNTSDIACGESKTGKIEVELISNNPGDYQYSIDDWVTKQTSPNFTNLEGGEYTVLVMDVNNGLCRAVEEVVIHDYSTVSFTIAVTGITCGETANGSIEIEASGGTGNYQYSIDGGKNWQAETVFTGLAAATYIVIVTDDSNCLSLTESVGISQPTDLLIDPVISNAACYQDLGSVLLNVRGGSGNYQYSINNGTDFQTENTFNDLPAATYNIVVKDDNDCTASDIIEITEPDEISFSIDKTDNTCKAQIEIIDVAGGDGAYQYSIDNGDNWQPTALFTNLGGNAYTIQVKDSKNCMANKEVELDTDYLDIKPDKLPAYKMRVPYSVTFESSAQSPLIFSTSDELPNGLILSSLGELYGTPTSQKSTPYEFTVTVIDANGCIISKTYELSGDLLIPQVITPNGDGKNDHFMEGFRVIIFDRLGIKIFNGDNGWDGTHNGKLVAPDTYFYIVFDNDQKKIGYISVLR